MSKSRLVIELPVPPSTNDLYKPVKGRMIKSAKYRAWEKEAAIAVYQQTLGKNLVTGPVVIAIEAPENNRRDISNYIKATEDLLVATGCIESDRCKCVRGVSAVWSDGDRVKVTVERNV